MGNCNIHIQSFFFSEEIIFSKQQNILVVQICIQGHLSNW